MLFSGSSYTSKLTIKIILIISQSLSHIFLQSVQIDNDKNLQKKMDETISL